MNNPKKALTKFTLINVCHESQGRVDGYWLQDCNGVTLEKAIERAQATERVNGNRIKVAVVEQIASSVPSALYYTDLEKLA